MSTSCKVERPRKNLEVDPITHIWCSLEITRVGESILWLKWKTYVIKEKKSGKLLLFAFPTPWWRFCFALTSEENLKWSQFPHSQTGP